VAFSLRNVVIASVVGAGIIAGAVVGARRCAPSSPGPAVSPSPNAGGRFVKIVFLATPDDAEIIVQGERKGKAGQVIELPRSEATLKVVIRRNGYLPQTIELAPDRDRYVKDIVLAPAAGAPASGVP
jgi:hypothetical protein